MAQHFEYLIALGSNLGNRLATLGQAINQIETRCGNTTARSSFYRTSPVGAADEEFINGAISVQSIHPPEFVMTTLLSIEERLGRTREVHWGNRTIDLDLILAKKILGAEFEAVCENLIINSVGLQIPHPRMLERDFVLVPAAEIAPDWIHPISGLELRAECRNRFPDGLDYSISVTKTD